MKKIFLTALLPILLSGCNNTADFYKVSATPGQPVATLNTFHNSGKINFTDYHATIILTIDQISVDHSNNTPNIKVTTGPHQFEVFSQRNKTLIYGCGTNLKAILNANTNYQIMDKVNGFTMTTWIEDDKHQPVSNLASCELHLPRPPVSMILFGVLGATVTHHRN